MLSPAQDRALQEFLVSEGLGVAAGRADLSQGNLASFWGLSSIPNICNEGILSVSSKSLLSVPNRFRNVNKLGLEAGKYFTHFADRDKVIYARP